MVRGLWWAWLEGRLVVESAVSVGRRRRLRMFAWRWHEHLFQKSAVAEWGTISSEVYSKSFDELHAREARPGSGRARLGEGEACHRKQGCSIRALGIGRTNRSRHDHLPPLEGRSMGVWIGTQLRNDSLTKSPTVTFHSPRAPSHLHWCPPSLFTYVRVNKEYTNSLPTCQWGVL